MGRAIIEVGAFFIAPYLAYMLYLVARSRNPVGVDHWRNGPLFWVSVAALAATIGATVYFGLQAERHSGAYVPAHVENGRVVPGRWIEK